MTMSPKESQSAWVSAFLASRRTTRSFLPTPIPQELLDQVLTDALTAPSWSNTRPFKIAVASGDKRDRLSAEFGARWSTVATNLKRGKIGKLKLFLTRYGSPTSNRLISKPYHADLKPASMRLGAELFGTLGIARDDRDARDAWWGTNYDFYGAPTELFVFIHTSLDIFAASDAGLMMENLILSLPMHMVLAHAPKVRLRSGKMRSEQSLRYLMNTKFSVALRSVTPVMPRTTPSGRIEFLSKNYSLKRSKNFTLDLSLNLSSDLLRAKLCL